MRIGIAGPLGTPDIEHLLDGDTASLPREMKGASLLVTLIEALIREGHEVVAFTTDPALSPTPANRVQARGRNLTVCYVPRRRRAFRADRGARGRMLDFFALERHALAQAMGAARPDIIHAHWSYEFAAGALDSGLPTLVTCHDSPRAILKTMPDLYRLGRLLMAKSVLKRCRHATVVSSYLVDELRAMTPATLEVIPNPLPDSLFALAAGRTTAAPDSGAPRIAMLLNGWSSRKNPEPGLLAMRSIRERFPAATMHLLGPGYGRDEEAAAWVRRNGMADAFVFHGWVPHAEAMRTLAGMDMLVHPALEESFGMTIAEAMALGVPVVAGSRSGAVPWVLGGEEGGGALVDVRSADRIAEAVLGMLTRPAEYERCARRGRARAEQYFSAAAVSAAYLAQYRRVLAAGRTGQPEMAA